MAKGPKITMRRKRKQQPKRTMRAGHSNNTLQLASLLNDPCSAPLVSPQYGASSGGYLTKLSKVINIDTSVGSSGCLIWFPDYAGRGASDDANMNVFIYQSSGVGTNIVNTTALPMGRGTSGTAATNGYADSDPAFAFINGNVVQDARTVAGCIKMIYTGRNDALSGRVGVFHGFSRDALLTGGGSQPPNLAEMFQYADHNTRTPMDQVEVKFRPSEGSEYYRSSGRVEDHCYTFGETGVSATALGVGTPGGVGSGIGFVWTGLDSTSSISFDLLKAIEWRPEFNTQLTAPPQSVSETGGNMVSRAVAYLDKHFPGWTHNLGQAGRSVATQIASAAFRGPSNAMVRQAVGMGLPLLL